MVTLGVIGAWCPISRVEAVAPERLTPAPEADDSASPAAPQEPGASAAVPRLYIREYRVTGAKSLPRIEVEEAVYPFLGPGRTNEDLMSAAGSLQKAYHDKGYTTVTVRVPEQSGRRGIIVLQVVEAPISRLRVKGSRYFSPSQIRKMVPSLAEGRVPNFKQVEKEIVRLNLPNRFVERQVLPEPLKPGLEPDTFEVDLNVKDSLPLHGSLELNNRYSPDTTPLRVNGSLSYSNLWQAGHTLGFSFQIAPERTEDAQVYSGYYMASVPGVDWLNLMVLGTKQDSDVSTLGGSAVAGRGYIIGGRANMTLPAPHGSKDFFHSLSVGMDYKHFDEDITFGGVTIPTPIDYYPISANYGATWLHREGMRTEGMTVLNAGVNFHLRGMGADGAEFDAKRFKADGSYIYFRGDVSHTRDLPGGLQAYVKAQGQAASQPLVNSEQYSAAASAPSAGISNPKCWVTTRSSAHSSCEARHCLAGKRRLSLWLPVLPARRPKTMKPATATSGASTRSSMAECSRLTMRCPGRRIQPTWPASGWGRRFASGTTSMALSMPGFP